MEGAIAEAEVRAVPLDELPHPAVIATSAAITTSMTPIPVDFVICDTPFRLDSRGTDSRISMSQAGGRITLGTPASTIGWLPPAL